MNDDRTINKQGRNNKYVCEKADFRFVTRDRKSNVWIRNTTKVRDVIKTISTLKCLNNVAKL